MSKVWYGSLQNRLGERAKSPKPEVGMGATEFYWSDREPWEIIAVKDDRHITVRTLGTKRIDSNGMSECQDYEYYSDPNGRTAELFLTNKGRWVERIGRRYGCNTFVIGYAEKYYDYSF